MQKGVRALGYRIEIVVLHAINRLGTLRTHKTKPRISTNNVQPGQVYVSGIHPILQFI